MEYYEVSGNATMQLKWLPPGPSLTPPVIIPKGQLLPPTLPPTEPPLDVPQTTDTLVYLHTDHLGSISVTTSASGQVVSQQRYDPWGKTIYTNGQTPTKLNYTGQRKDDSALLYYRARYYDPALARFLSADSRIPGVSALAMEPTSSGAKDKGPLDPQVLNRYSYVLNNPLKHVDMSGHAPSTPPMVRGNDVGDYKVMLSITIAAMRIATASKDFHDIRKDNWGPVKSPFAIKDWADRVGEDGKWDMKKTIRDYYGLSVTCPRLLIQHS